MNVTTELKDGVGLVTVTGPLLAVNADQFRASFQQFLGKGGFTNAIVDLAGVEQIDSAGLGGLIAALKRTTDAGGDLKIARLQKRPRLVFEITRSHKVFEIFDSLEEALGAAK